MFIIMFLSLVFILFIICSIMNICRVLTSSVRFHFVIIKKYGAYFGVPFDFCVLNLNLCIESACLLQYHRIVKFWNFCNKRYFLKRRLSSYLWEKIVWWIVLQQTRIKITDERNWSLCRYCTCSHVNLRRLDNRNKTIISVLETSE